jgi:hypothetical protein
MKVRATRQGFWGGVLRERGAILDWPDNERLPSWVEPVDKPVAPAPVEEERGAPNPVQAAGTWREPAQPDEGGEEI